MSNRAPLTAREQRIVRMVREGRPDAEIAVRLGATVGATRREIAALVATHGLSGREELSALNDRGLADSSGGQGARPVTMRRVVAGIAGAALVVAIVLIVTRGNREPSADDGATATALAAVATVTREASATAVPSSATASADPTVLALAAQPLSLAQHGDFREYEHAELIAAGFVDTGTFIAIPLNRLPAARSSFRAGFTAVETSGAGYLNLQAEGWHRGFPAGGGFSSTQAVGLTATVAEQPLFMTFSTAPGVNAESRTRLLPVGDGQVAFYATDDGAPIVILAVSTADGRRVPAVVDLLGKLWVRPAPVSGPVADDTGELLDAADAVAFGPLDPPRFLLNRTVCGERDACVAVVHHQIRGGLTALADGVASCRRDEEPVVELATNAFTLRFVRSTLLPPGRGEDCVGEFPRTVASGEPLSEHGSWEVSASSADGTPLHVVVAELMLHVGVEREIDTCTPCLAVGS